MSQKFPTKPHRSFSELQTIRKNSKIELPTVLQNLKALSIEDNEALGAAADHADIEKAFPHTYGKPYTLSFSLALSSSYPCMHLYYLLQENLELQSNLVALQTSNL